MATISLPVAAVTVLLTVLPGRSAPPPLRPAEAVTTFATPAAETGDGTDVPGVGNGDGTAVPLEETGDGTDVPGVGNGDGTDTVEIPGNDPPPVDGTVLSSALDEGTRAAVEIRSRVRELARARVDLARGNRDGNQQALEAVSEQLRGTLDRLRREGHELDVAQLDMGQRIDAARSAGDAFTGDLITLYTRGPVTVVDGELNGDDPIVAVSRVVLSEILLATRRAAVLDAYIGLPSGGEGGSSELAELRARGQALRQESESLAPLYTDRIDLREKVLAADLALREVEALPDDLLFPVDGEYNFVDTFLAPRMFGTRYAHRHQGVDIFAERDTPLVAVERGVVGRVGTINLGGNRVWLIGESGTEYYYAHLSGFADITPGQFVEAGTVLGYVGTSGNAVGTPPHVHFEVHPGGGRAVNPTPLMNQLAERDRQR
ncbi:MAG TPA: M23 family metallopeptidase [Acidimicrobiales bacterium]|nr:M23 family metallopeptidase [Acidimicrobiales bacterium]